MSNSHSHCRLCAKPSARSRLVCVDDEVIDIKQKMLLVNVDVSAPSPLPRGVCYSCLCLLEKTATFLHQVSVAQNKLTLIYQDSKDFSEETADDFDIGVKEEPQDVEGVEIMMELCRDELPEETESRESFDIAEEKKKRMSKNESIVNNKVQKHDMETKFLKTAIKIESNPIPRRQSKRKPKIQAGAEESTPPSKQGFKKKVKKQKHICECGSTWKTRYQLKMHQKTHNKRTLDYSCHICGRAYIAPSSLHNHMITHKPKKFKCTQCEKTFHEQWILKLHATQHSSERPFACNQCEKTFAQKRHLTAHSLTHSDLRPHVCSYCHKAFRFRKTLVVHIRLHTGLRPFCCEHCGRDFYDHSSHHKHVRTAHGADPRKKKEVDTDAKSEVIGDDKKGDQQ